MKLPSATLPRRFLRISLLTSLLGAAGLIIISQALTLHEKWALLDMSRQNIAAYEKRLARPVPPNPFAAYSRFVAPAPGETFPSVFQDEMIHLITVHEGRITDIRELPAAEGRDGIRAIRHLIVFEGDLQTLTDVLGEFEASGRPLLVNTLSVRPVSAAPSPDRNLRMSIETTLWVEAPA